MDPLAALLDAPPPPGEMERILALPTVLKGRWGSPVSALARHPEAPRLNDVQEMFLRECTRARDEGAGPWGLRGAVGLIGCGGGKTLCAQLAPVIFGAERPLLILPASLNRQLDDDIAEWAPHYRLACPERLTYGKLSQPDSAGLIQAIRPDLIILDEAHMLANPQSARWKRLDRYIHQARDCRVVVLSGTLTWAELGQMRHLLLAALRDWCPLPADHTLEHWANCIDMGGLADRDDRRYLAPLVRMFGEGPPKWGSSRPSKADYRRACHHRMESAPGVVMHSGEVSDVALRMRRWVPPVDRTEAHTQALARIDSLWELPDGTELVDALEHSRHSRTLALGFYLRWVPGSADPAWLACRRAWSRVVRAHVQYGGYDSPALVARAAEAGRLDRAATEAWDAWAMVDRGVLPYREWAEPPTEVVWVDDSWAPAVVGAYLWRLPGGDDGVLGAQALVWVQSPELGAALGLPYHGQGDPAPTSGPAAVSIRVHGKGWNGQAYREHLILEPPRSAGTWEQLLARPHRPGQTGDVHVSVCQATDHQVANLNAGLQGARYTRDTTGTVQRLLLADWEV